MLSFINFRKLFKEETVREWSLERGDVENSELAKQVEVSCYLKDLAEEITIIQLSQLSNSGAIL